jgi:hypothetical protein
MPPPLPPASITLSRESVAPVPSQSESPESTRTAGKGKNAGFKPIGQPSASLKRFFPGDDESEPELLQRPSGSSRVTQVSSVSTTLDRFGTSSVNQQITTIELDVHSQQNGSHIHSSRIEVHSVQQRPRSLQDTQSQIPTPATPSPIPHRPSRRLPTEDSRIHQDAMSTRVAHIHHLMSPMHTQHIPSHMQSQEPNTPIITRPPTPTRTNEELYSIVSQVGEGTFGKVYKAKNTATGKFVALKRIRMESERDGFPVTAMREIKLLQSLRHENVVRLYEMMVSSGM